MKSKLGLTISIAGGLLTLIAATLLDHFGVPGALSFDTSEFFPGWKSWEFLGFVTGILSVAFLLFTRIPQIQYLNWPAAIVTSAVYGFLFREWTLYGNAILQIPFFVLSVIGAIKWAPQLRGLEVTIRELPTRFVGKAHFFIAVALALLATVPVYFLLDYYNDASPLWDGLILTISLAAFYFQLRKYVQSWYLWIVVDIIAIPFHWDQTRYATSILYLAYMLMCFVGLAAWRREARLNKIERRAMSVVQ